MLHGLHQWHHGLKKVSGQEGAIFATDTANF